MESQLNVAYWVPTPMEKFNSLCPMEANKAFIIMKLNG
jgi:hypothetical protein